MQAAVLPEYGTPHFGEFPDPDPAGYPGSIEIEVRAATLNNIDRVTAAGQHYLSPKTFPVVAGIEGAGTTTDGQRVYFARPLNPYGSMAERTLVPSEFVLPIPGQIDFPTAATLGNAGMAALMPLASAETSCTGKHVVVLGGTGVVGRLAVQAARLLGARSITVVGRDQQALESTVELGATTIISSAGRNTDSLTAAIRGDTGGVELIVDYTWGEPALAALRAGRPGVRLVQAGDRADANLALPAQLLRALGASVTGFMPLHYGPQAMKDAYQQLVSWTANGDLIVDYELVPLASVREAWERAATTRHKLVLVP